MKTIAIDFDDTCCEDAFPNVGKEIEGCSTTLKYLISKGYKLVLWTCREHRLYEGVDPLQEALNWFREKGIELVGINSDEAIRNKDYEESRKIHTDFIIDDKCVGIPKIEGHLDWYKVKELIEG